MNLHEFQAKEILGRRGVPVPEGQVAWTPDEAARVAREIRAPRFAVKAQILAGGRGEAGGIHFGATAESVGKLAGSLIGRTLVTSQTGAEGRTVRRVYVEAAVAAAREVYLAILVDRAKGGVALVGTEAGGGDVEARIRADPGLLATLPLEGLRRPDDAALRGFAGRIGLGGAVEAKATALMKALVVTLLELDATLIEINPLVVTEADDLVAVDVKMVLDDNALYRHPDLRALKDDDEADPVELEAQRHDINFVRMDGDIGVVTNGAGLGLATHDMLSDAGGRPANFMDIRTTATSLQIAKGIGLLLSNPKVAVILVNVHGGGMTRCDTIVEALGIAVRRSGRSVPVVFRVAGQNAGQARTMMVDRRIRHERVDGMADAAKRAVALAKGGRG
ncbi:MAG: ADP-forming succinate--CoA ligase subunit beta [Geminicoccaceae bacterium]|nr:ADP-forming succinate--CoA ligase subunit beta [Geminicoccaceae bacterium]